jgi:hypothetical protein
LTETDGIIKIGDTAETTASETAASGAVTEPFKIRKRIGYTTYDVEAHFSPNSRETLDEKILRLIRNEALKDGGETS